MDQNDADRIAQALTVEGGHLSIGRGGCTLFFAKGCRLSGFPTEPMKTTCIAAGLPVIDSRNLDIDTVWDLAWRSPLIAVGEPTSPEPSGGFSLALLTHFAEPYRTAGADVINLPRHVLAHEGGDVATGLKRLTAIERHSPPSRAAQDGSVRTRTTHTFKEPLRCKPS